jgi:hypothetical protein
VPTTHRGRADRRVVTPKNQYLEDDVYLSRSRTVGLLSVAAMAGSAATAVSAVGQDLGQAPINKQAALVQTTLAPSAPIDPTLNGVAPGGAPWQLAQGEARLNGRGNLRVHVSGLILVGVGSPGGVNSVTASLYCGTDTNAVGMTPSAHLSRSGEARMEGSFTLPSNCISPLVLVHPNGNATSYIAASGFRS